LVNSQPLSADGPLSDCGRDESGVVTFVDAFKDWYDDTDELSDVKPV
jgi:hypothetical protein